MKNIYLSIIIAFFFLFGQTNTVFAQNANDRMGIGMYLSTYEYQGDLGSDFFRFHDPQGGGGVSFNYYLSPSFDIDAYLKAGKINYFADNFSVRARFTSADINLKYKFYNNKIFKEDALVGPYLMFGLGNTTIRSHGYGKDLASFSLEPNGFNIQAGLGLRFHINKSFSVVIQSRQYFPFIDDYDGSDLAAINGKDRYLEHSIGLIFYLSPKNDKKADVLDWSKSGIDSKGALLDSDGDSIPDIKDKCPMEYGLAEFNGCPDTDFDGIPDWKDYCPKKQGLEKNNGCPDSDNDGIVDVFDECPDTKAGILVNYKGCPRDYDRDGVPDYLDKAPKIPGLVENQGAPALDQKVAEQIHFTAKNVHFKTGSSVLSQSSKKYLDELAKILVDYPNIKLRIEGHTDNTGNSEKNKVLSQKRANAVLDYLVKKGVNANNLEAIGYGQEKPVASNSDQDGRSLNRRVEFKIIE